MTSEPLTTAPLLDEQDELREFRNAFVIEDPSTIYLDGNSLGRLPRRTLEVMDKLLRAQWGGRLVGGWRDWYDLPQRIGAKIARLIGAHPDEVIACDSTSVNLFKLTVAALRLQAPRATILTDDANFPSDVYVSAGVAETFPGVQVRHIAVESSPDAAAFRIEGALDDDSALLSLSHTWFKRGYVYDMAEISEAARRAGALTLWDLSHSIGALPVDLNGAGADLAVGCGYKYICGGPGAPAFLYVRRDLQARLVSPIWGWFGQRNPFDFSLEYEPADGIDRFLAGTPPVLSLAAVEPALDLLWEAGIDRLRAKSLRQTDLLIELFDSRLAPVGFRLMTPREHARRGSHVSLAHPEAWRICQALIAEANVVPDFRAPDVLRLGVTPLSTTFREIETAVERIEEIVVERRFAAYPALRARVT